MLQGSLQIYYKQFKAIFCKYTDIQKIFVGQVNNINVDSVVYCYCGFVYIMP